MRRGVALCNEEGPRCRGPAYVSGPRQKQWCVEACIWDAPRIEPNRTTAGGNPSDVLERMLVCRWHTAAHTCERDRLQKAQELTRVCVARCAFHLKEYTRGSPDATLGHTIETRDEG